jgi:hypothetical protein
MAILRAWAVFETLPLSQELCHAATGAGKTAERSGGREEEKRLPERPPGPASRNNQPSGRAGARVRVVQCSDVTQAFEIQDANELALCVDQAALLKS